MQNGDGTSGKKWHKSDTGSSPSVRATPATTQTKTAAQAGTLNGGASKYESIADAKLAYHNAASAATCAARWYAENRGNCPHPVVPTLRAMFALSALEAVQAIREANGGGQ
ncbi:MAG: hypothetical protein E5X41_06060 [Mesorhizobium sp.]|nr:MAG: hypothetical protein E5X41_06060 [Mesorhizobium sp.]